MEKKKKVGRPRKYKNLQEANEARRQRARAQALKKYGERKRNKYSNLQEAYEAQREKSRFYGLKKASTSQKLKPQIERLKVKLEVYKQEFPKDKDNVFEDIRSLVEIVE